jgi:protein disulfide-isomerase
MTGRRARDLLKLEASTSNTPYYYIGDLADVEEHLGNIDHSVELLAEAYAKAKGPASRFQWGYNYLDGLLRMKPDDLATIERVGSRSSPSSMGRIAFTAARCRASTSSTPS